MLRTNEQIATVNHVNIRAEQHGDQAVTGCDINIQFETGAKVLDSFDKDLRPALYTDEDPKSPQRRIPGAGREDPLSGPRFKFNGLLGPLAISKEWPGYKAQLVFGDIASSVDISLDAVKVTKIKASPKDGGTCQVNLQLQCHPAKDDYGDLALLLGKEVKLSLTPPSAAELKKLKKDEQKKDDGNEPPEDD